MSIKFDCTPEQIAVCPFTKHFSDIHHNQFPKKDYRTLVEKGFRELPENKERLCRNEHQEIHATTEPPIKPSREVMMAAIAHVITQGECDVA